MITASTRITAGMALALIATLTGAIGGAASGGEAPAPLIEHDFEDGTSFGWSQGTIATSPSGQKFLGRFGEDTLTYTPGLLAPVDTPLRLEFDLYIIGTMDGSSTEGEDGFAYGPDRFIFSVIGDGASTASSVVRTTFSNVKDDPAYPQAFPGAFPEASNPAGTGAAATDSLGYPPNNDDSDGFFGDSTYRISMEVPADQVGSTTKFKIRARGLIDPGASLEDDESWGVDNAALHADCDIVGTEEAETLNGTPASETICGLGGDDDVNGGDGNDTLYLGAGSDTADGGAGEDTIFGGAGTDEFLFGGPDNDKLFSGPGGDELWGGTGSDELNGGPDNDELYGRCRDCDEPLPDEELDNDSISGGSGGDVLKGQAAGDILTGGTGEDVMFGGPGWDTMLGDGGDDDVFGGGGRDDIEGGDGHDLLVGQAGSNKILGRSGDDEIDGGPEDDTIFGGPGRDRIDGKAGSDKITGNGHRDVLIGGPDNDTFRAADNVGEPVRGGMGNDKAEHDDDDEVTSIEVRLE